MTYYTHETDFVVCQSPFNLQIKLEFEKFDPFFTFDISVQVRLIKPFMDCQQLNSHYELCTCFDQKEYKSKLIRKSQIRYYSIKYKLDQILIKISEFI